MSNPSIIHKLMLPHDKANHAIYGASIASVGAVIHSWWIGAALCILAGVGLEVYQRARKTGHPSVLDALATIAGGALVVVPLAVPLLT